MTASRDVEARWASDRAWLLALARALTRDDDAAEDLVQEVQLAVLRHPPSHPGSVRGWLARTLRNLLANRRRDAAAREDRERFRGAPEGSPDPQQHAQELEIRAQLIEAVRALDEPLRSTIFERYYKGRSAEEIAHIQGIPAPTARARLARGLEILREHLDRKHRGGRDTWMGVLVLFGERGRRELVTASTTSAASMGALAGLLGALLVAAGTWWALRGEPERDEARAQVVTSAEDQKLGESSEGARDRAEPRLGEDSKRAVVASSAPPSPPLSSASEYTITGRVAGLGDRPLLGAQVSVENTTLTLLSEGTLRGTGQPRPRDDIAVAATDAHGTFELRIPLEPLPDELAREVEAPERALFIALVVRAPEHAPSKWSSTLAPGDRRSVGTIRLERAGQVFGRVLGGDGRAIAGARVRAAWPEIETHQLVVFPAIELQASQALATTTTDSEGRYRLTGVAARAVRVYVDHSGFDPRASGILELAGADGVEAPEIVLVENRAWIRGRIVDQLGQPVARASVSAVAENGGRRRLTTSRADGSFQLDLASEGAFDIAAWGTEKQDGRALRRSVTSASSGVELVLRPERSVRVRVRAEDGGALGRGLLVVLPRDGAQGRDYPLALDPRELELPPFPFSISVHAPEFAPATLQIPDPTRVGDELELVLARKPKVRGRVVDHDGRPVPRAHMRLFHPAREPGAPELCALEPGTAPVYGYANAEGEFELVRTPGLPWQVRAEKDGVGAGDSPVFDARAIDSGLRIELVTHGALSIQVASRSGRYVGDTWLSISRGDGLTSTGRAGSEGRIRFEGLAAGTWWIEVQEMDPVMGLRRAGGPGTRSTTCQVESERTTEVVLHLDDTGACAFHGLFHLEGAMDEPWTVASSTLPARINSSKLTPIEADGSFALDFGAPGPAWIVARSTTKAYVQRELRWPVEVAGGEKQHRLTIASTVVRVRNPATTKGAWVHRWRGADGIELDTHFDAPVGSTELELRLPCGPSALHRLQPNGRIHEQESMSLDFAAGGAARIDLTPAR